MGCIYTFEKLAKHILELKKLNSRNTYLSASFQLKRLIRHFGRKSVDDITETNWHQYVLAEQAKSPGRKMFDDRKYMRMVLLYAYRENFIAKKIRLPIPDKASEIGREISKREVKRLMQLASPELRFQMEIALKTGMRLREMLHLRWNQFHWDRGTILFLNSDTKTRRAREIPIPKSLYRRFQKRSLRSKSPFVFPSPSDKNRPQHNNRTAWRRVKRLAQLRARWHDWRHTCASWMLRAGVKPHVVKKFLGMSEAVLNKVYAHLNQDDLQKAAAVMDRAA